MRVRLMRRLVSLLPHVGIVAVVVGLSLVHAEAVADPPYSYQGSFRFAWSLAFMALLSLSAYGAGLPDLPRSRSSALATSLAAAGGAALGISILQLVVGDALLPRFVVFGSAILLVPWYLVCVAVARGGRARAEAADGVLVVGSTPEADAVRHELERAPERPASVVAVVTVDELAPPAPEDLLVRRAEQVGASVVVLDRVAQTDERAVTQAASLHESGVRVRTLSLFYDEWLGKLPVSELERVSLMFDIGEVHRARYGRLKRLLDVTCGVIGCLGLLVLTPVLAVLNPLGNRGPLFFGQERVGKNGTVFRIWKFRTMRAVPDGETAGEWTGEEDPRITPLGRVLRRTHLDELPQMLNILVGDLSIVGPRPEQPHYVAELAEALPFYQLRHLVRPGLTGWAQVKYGYAGNERDAMEKLQYDFYYLRYQGLQLDLRIIGRTVRSVTEGGGR